MSSIICLSAGTMWSKTIAVVVMVIYCWGLGPGVLVEARLGDTFKETAVTHVKLLMRGPDHKTDR